MRRADMPAPGRAAGFTLIELLVAMAMLALMTVLGWRGLDSIVRGRQALNADLALTRDMQLSFAQLQSDCRQLAPVALLGNRAVLLVQPGRLLLARMAFADGEATQLQAVEYRLRGGVLSRWESAKTRDLRDFDRLWSALAADADGSTRAAQSVALQARLSALHVRLWDSSSGLWQAVGAGETAAFVQPRTARPRWSGLELALDTRPAGDGAPARIQKTFLLEGP